MGGPKMWDVPPREVIASPCEVHVWAAQGPFDPGALALSMDPLSADEVSRSRAFLRAADRHRFVATRLLLRNVLGRMSNRSPAALTFAYGPQGKPYLASPSTRKFGFNVSHSGDIVVCAVAPVDDLGVDVERIRDLDFDRLAAYHFGPAEREVFERLPSDVRQTTFFRVWTRKEAYIKAIGTGFSTSSQTFTVSVAPSDAPRLLAPPPGREARSWCMIDFQPASGYAGAVVIEGSNWTCRFWDAAKDPALAPWARALDSV